MGGQIPSVDNPAKPFDCRPKNRSILGLFLRSLYYVYVGILTAVIIVGLAVLLAPTWHSHLLNLLHRSWFRFLTYQGTTSRGFLSPILFTFFIVVGTLFVIRVLRGKSAMLKHWQENAAITMLVTTAGLLVIYGSEYEWDVVQEVYGDHTTLVGRTRELRTERDSARHERDDLESKLQQKPRVVTKFINPIDEQLRINTRIYGHLPAMSGNSVYFVVGTTNRTIESVRVRLTCNHEFTVLPPLLVFAADDSGFTITKLEGKQINATNYEYERDGMAWTQDRPLGLSILSKSHQSLSCQFTRLP